jgi:hypothetical protein
VYSKHLTILPSNPFSKNQLPIIPLAVLRAFHNISLPHNSPAHSDMPPPHPKYFQMPESPAPLAARPKPPRPHPKPLLRLEFRDLSEEGAKSFLSLLDCANVLQEAVDGVLALLYTHGSEIPPTRSVTLILRSMGGVAYTTGRDIDSDHKEIHFSTDYIAKCPAERRKQEMLGVLRHEMVHCWYVQLGICT